MASIKVATGLKVYDIEDEHGNVRGQITINPNDMNFLPRAKQVEASIMAAIDRVSVLQDGDEIVLGEIDSTIKQDLNTLFGDDNLSDVVFGKQSCLNTINGVTFVERFLEAFMPIVMKAFQDEAKKSAKRISKYTERVVR